MTRQGLTAAQTVMERCDVLAGYSEEPDQLTRRFATDAMREANETVAAWMAAAGMVVRRDNVGNSIGHYDAADADSPTLLLGPHLDTVVGAGKHDGPLGILVGLALAGTFDLSELGWTDADGVALAEVIRSFGGDPESLAQDRWRSGELLGTARFTLSKDPSPHRESH